jgi:transcriptional regulator with XRE-family HTH domain
MMDSLGDRLKMLRTEKRMTQYELAKELNMARSTYAQYEVNRRQPEIDTLKKLADYFNVTTDYLLGRTEYRSARLARKEELKW